MKEFRFTPAGSNKEILLRDLGRVNVILGRNGSGKSRLLRDFDQMMSSNEQFRVRYVTPERAGTFQRDGNVDTSASTHPQWASNVRRNNQAPNFKQMSHLHLREAEFKFLRALENSDARGKTFQSECLEPISRLLSNVSIERSESDYQFRSSNGELVKPEQLSSGESEAIALAAELLSFFRGVDPYKNNVLLLDEPDVHQHPDLQARFGYYLLDQFATLDDEQLSSVFVVLATHSTPLVCALAASNHTVVGTKDFDSSTVTFSGLSDRVKEFAPFFGHPLSLSLSQDSILILEGEDDERVWQQAARSSNGQIRLFPVLAQSVVQQTQLERLSGPLLTAIYDDPIAYSLRDGDGKRGPIDQEGPVVRFRLQCYEIENALVTTECLANLGMSWHGFQERAKSWAEKHPEHRETELVLQLISSEDRFRDTKIKRLRNVILEIADSKKPWEVVVGQALAGLVGLQAESDDPFSLSAFIGVSASKALLKAK